MLTEEEKLQLDRRKWELSPITQSKFQMVIVENITDEDLEDGKFTKGALAQEIMEDFQRDWWAYMKRAKESLLLNKGLLQKGWLVQFTTRPTRIYKVIEIGPSSATLEDILNGEKEIVSPSAQVIVLFKNDENQKEE